MTVRDAIIGFGGEGNGKCIIEFIYDDNSLTVLRSFQRQLGLL